MSVEILVGNALYVLRRLPSNHYHTCLTSPPYWGLRDYGIEPVIWEHPDTIAYRRATGDWESVLCEHVWGDWQESHDTREETQHGKTRTTDRYYGDESRRFDGNHQKHTAGSFCQLCGAWLGCLGLEPDPDLYVAHLVDIFREVRRVLRDDGTLWLNLGDCYARQAGDNATRGTPNTGQKNPARMATETSGNHKPPPGLKPKDLVGIPWLVAFALRADGWWLRSAPPWIKNNAMPESVRDRPTTAHEYWFLLSKSQRYFWDADAVREPCMMKPQRRLTQRHSERDDAMRADKKYLYELRDEPGVEGNPAGRNRRTSDFWNESLEDLISDQLIYVRHLLDVRDNGGLLLDEDGDPLGLMFPTKSFKGAHFATFSPDLIEPLLKASTSAYGCCPECGAPWERVTEKVDTGETQKMADGWDTGSGGHSTIHRNGREKGEAGKPIMANVTTGFRPTCDHDAAPVACRVVDPFAGACTTGLEADRMGLDATLIEIKDEYAEMGRDRIAEDAPPMFEEITTLPAEALEAEPGPEQLGMWG